MKRSLKLRAERPEFGARRLFKRCKCNIYYIATDYGSCTSLSRVKAAHKTFLLFGVLLNPSSQPAEEPLRPFPFPDSPWRHAESRTQKYQ